MLRRILTSALLLGTVACGSGFNTPTTATAVATSTPFPLSGTVTTGGSDVPTPGMTVMTDGATVTNFNNVAPLGPTRAFISCVPEFVDVTGSLHVMFHETLNPDGTRHFIGVNNPQDVTGIGSVTGNMYRGTGVTLLEFTITPEQYAAGEPYMRTFVNNFRFIGQGPGNNSTVHDNEHITVNANGDVTTTVDNVTVDCK